ncbi:MAG: CAP domain-containing protein [Croceivirga sp.]
MNLQRTIRNAYIVCIVALMASCTSPSSTDEELLFEETNTVAELEYVQLSDKEEALYNMVNDHRESIGLDRLIYDGETYAFAFEHNEYMIGQGEMSHDNFTDRASKISDQTSANFVAENVAKDFEYSEAALQAWLSSEGHRNNIEGDFTHTTLSIVSDREGNFYYTQIFFRN